MSFLHWMAVLGSLLLILTLASTYLRWLPVTTSALYLLFGLAIGPLGLGIWQVDFQQIAGWMEHLTEVAVLVSLFVGGMKLRLHFRHPAWLSAYLLAGPVMLASIAGVALIALSYFIAESAGAWGFLAAFAAGVGLRHAEIATSSHSATLAGDSGPNPAASGATAKAGRQRVDARPSAPKTAAGVVIREILSFGHTLERSLEVLLVTLLGALLALHWDWRALPLAVALFCVIRPLSVILLVRVRGVSGRQRRLLGWFGIRGIGSLYYLSYALTHGLAPEAVDDTIALTLSVVAQSIVLHGLTTQPLLARYERQQGRSGKP